MAAARAAVLPRPGERLLPALSGLLLAASFPPLHLLVPPFVALAPFAFWVTRLPAGLEGDGSAVRGGLVLGLVSHGLLLHWLVPALAWTTAWAPLAFVFVVGVLAVVTALVAWVLHTAVHGARVPLWLALPVAWTAGEWLRGNLPGPLAFPWLDLSVGLTGVPEALGLAELVGGRGVTFWLALVSGLVAWLVAGWRTADFVGRAVGVLVVALVVAVPAGWGVHRASTLSADVVARVAVVGTDVPAAARTDPEAWNALLGPVLDQAAEALTGERFDLVVLPEGTVMTAGTPSLSRGLLPDMAGGLGVPILAGVYAGGAPPRNLAVLASPEGSDPAVYQKRRLVPWVEWRPGDQRTTPAGPPVLGEGVRLGSLICFEAIFPEAARGARLAGAEMLVNVSNDAWFSASGGWGRAGRAQHAAHLVVRAVEHRTGAVRSANGGASYVVDPVGRVGAFPAVGPGPAVGVADIRSVSTLTFFTRAGDLAGKGSAVAAVLLLWLGRRGASGRVAVARDSPQSG